MALWFEPPGRKRLGSEMAASAEAAPRPALPLPIVYDDHPIEPTRWEYHCLLIDPEREPIPQEEALNKLGTEGWVLSGVLDQSRSSSRPFLYFYFVRPAQATSPQPA
jgi:hypothetical protein